MIVLTAEDGLRLDTASSLAFEAATPVGESDEMRKARLQQYKEATLSQLMTEIAGFLRAEQPQLQIGLYSWGPHVPFNHPVAQSWPDWVRKGYLDVLNVSGYCYPDNYGDDYLKAFEKRLRDAGDLAREAGGKVQLTFALGVRTSHGAIQEASELADYLAIARNLGYPGVAAFAWGSMKNYAAESSKAGYFRFSESLPASVTNAWTIRCTVDFGKDRGQHFGSLFEIVDENDQVLAGAGFQGAYNTYYRSERQVLHTFVKLQQEQDAVSVTSFSRPTDGCQHYLYDAAGKLYCSDRKSPDETLCWNPDTEMWESAAATVFQLGGKTLQLSRNRISCNGNVIFEFDNKIGGTGSYYYAAGHLFFHVAVADSPERETRLYACPWNPDDEPAVSLDEAIVLALTAPGEFPYSYGQLHSDVFAGTNNGGMYRFRDGKWDTLREADPKTSFQVYTMINYYDRLLMGQYPTGELFEIVGDQMLHLPGWPPRPPDASARAREAQTMAIYGGDLYVGVWPWGELWRLSDSADNWSYANRFFTHPDILPDVTAPYEVEMTELGVKVNNLWGQRVTGLVPYCHALLVSTSNKNGAAYEDRLKFLNDMPWQEYGAVHKYQIPGNLSAPVEWKETQTQFTFGFSDFGVQVNQDDSFLGQIPITRPLPETTFIRWGQGVFGPLCGKLTHHSVKMK